MRGGMAKPKIVSTFMMVKERKKRRDAPQKRVSAINNEIILNLVKKTCFTVKLVWNNGVWRL